MKNEPTVITLDTSDPATARIFAAADRHPMRVAIAGVVYRIEREDHYRYYHPEVRQTAGETMGDERWREDLRRIVRDAKPKAKSLKWGEETRYGREDDFNDGYNEALDEYEASLLARIDAGT